MKAFLQPAKAVGSAVSFTTTQRKQGLKTVIDNRPTAITQYKLARAIQAKRSGQAVAQLETTISAHGGLSTDPATGNFVPFIIPQGVTVVLAAPEGATLGDLALTISDTATPNQAAIQGAARVNTTKEIWTNIPVATQVLAAQNIPKTPKQTTALQAIVAGQQLTRGNKLVLAALEKTAEFEAWSQAFVSQHIFIAHGPGTQISDMNLNPFPVNSPLRSATPDAQNLFVADDITLSQFIAANPLETRFIVNACSHAVGANFTGFQIDR